MCKGLALIMNAKGKIFVDGSSSHGDLITNKNLYGKSLLKYEIVVDESKRCGYVVEVDGPYRWASTRADQDVFKEMEALLPEIKRWIKKNELRVLRYLLNAQIIDDAYKDMCGDLTLKKYTEWLIRNHEEARIQLGEEFNNEDFIDDFDVVA